MGALLLLSGCGGKATAIPADHTDGVAGMPGDGAGEVPLAPDESPPDHIPVAPDEVPVTPDEVPVAPDEVPVTPDEVPVTPDEVPVTPEDIAAEVERISGTSFTLLAHDGDGGSETCDEYAIRVRPFFSAATYHFRKTEAGELELVSSLPQPWLRIDTSKLQRTKSGWRTATPLPSGACMGWGSEEERKIALPTPKTLDLAFSGADPDGKPTALALTARFAATDELEAATVTSTGVRDTTPPRLLQLPAYSAHTAGWGARLTVGNRNKAAYAYYISDAWFAWDLPRSFVFSEALAPGWSAAIEDADGNVVELAQSNGSAELEIGFDVAAYHPQGYRWVLHGQDLAGNPIEAGGEYPVEELALGDGTFEAATPVAGSYYDENGGESWFNETPACRDAARYLETVCTDATAPERPDATALVGTRSLFLPTQAFFRIARQPNATQVSFVARNLGGEASDIWLGVMSLDAGSLAGLQYTRVEGQLLEGADAANAVRQFTLPLPAGTGDVLVSVQPAHDGEETEPLWLDSLRTE